MRIEATDSHNTLFVVDDVVDQALVRQLQEQDWSKLSGVPSLPHPNWNRTSLSWEQTPLLRELDIQIRSAKREIESALGLEFTYYYNDFWLDRGGFSVPIHTDSDLHSSLQLYWVGPLSTGTTFLWSRDPKDIRYQMQFRPNSGYLMLNQPVDGTQFLQWHGMFETLSPDTLRLTSYARFGSYWPHK
jgi:hypothetical protein